MRHAVVDRKRLVEVVIDEHVQDRRERLARDDGRLPRHPHERRAHIIRIRAAELDTLAALHLAALLARIAERLLHRVERRAIDQRADERARFERIAHLHRCERLLEARQQLIGDAAVHDQPAQRRAALARGADRGERHRAHDEIEIRARRDDHPVVAAELENAAREPPAQHLRDLDAHPHAARRGHERHLRRRAQRLADIAAAEHELMQPFRHDAGVRLVEFAHRLRKQRVARDRGERRLLGRLPDDRIAAHERERRVPRPHGDREVERGDHAAHAERMPGFHHPVAGALGRDRQAVKLPRQADREIADIDHFLHFAEPLGRDLARLERDEPAERGLVLAQHVAEHAHELAAHRRGHRAPFEERLMRGVDLAFGVRRGVGGERGERRAVDGRAGGQRTALPAGQIDVERGENVVELHRFLFRTESG
ncbi:hypothetical protein X945_5803 [Burkholderia pseudomallei ABCPW 107]|nr:hypothetical protein X945_5803 [Burkholderia pseudomallei ABCPW 107]